MSVKWTPLENASKSEAKTTRSADRRISTLHASQPPIQPAGGPIQGRYWGRWGRGGSGGGGKFSKKLTGSIVHPVTIFLGQSWVVAHEIAYQWRGPLTDDEMVDLVRSYDGSPEGGWWDRIRSHSLGWVTARDPTSRTN